jgi:hypothetical protein
MFLANAASAVEIAPLDFGSERVQHRGEATPTTDEKETR